MRRVSPLERIRPLSRTDLDVAAALDRLILFLGYVLFDQRTPDAGLHLLMKQLYLVGVLSLAIIIASGLFTDMVLVLQGRNILISYGSERAAGRMVALTLPHGLGPVMTDLLFTGRAGSALIVEIGNMKATERLSSLEMVGIDLLKYIAVSCLWTGFVSTPPLATIFSVVGIWGGVVVVVDWLGVCRGSFWANMQNSVQFTGDVPNGAIESIVFALVVAWIVVYQDYDCEPTLEGTGWATTRTVAYASLVVLGLDFILATSTFGDS